VPKTSANDHPGSINQCTPDIPAHLRPHRLRRLSRKRRTHIPRSTNRPLGEIRSATAGNTRGVSKRSRTDLALTLITQNVDGLHQRAGSSNVIEFHGNLFANRCFVEGCVVTDADMSTDVPLCPGCGGMLRPGVVWFGEAIPGDALQAADTAASSCDVFLSIGTSSLVWPAAGLAKIAQQQGANVIEINLDATPLTDNSHFALSGKSGVVLPELVNCLAV